MFLCNSRARRSFKFGAVRKHGGCQTRGLATLGTPWSTGMVHWHGPLARAQPSCAPRATGSRAGALPFCCCRCRCYCWRGILRACTGGGFPFDCVGGPPCLGPRQSKCSEASGERVHWESHHRVVAPRDARDEGTAQALDPVPPCFVHRLARRHVRLDRRAGYVIEGDLRGARPGL